MVSLRGFLKLQCTDSNNLTYFKCSHSNTQYQVAYEPEAEFNCSDEKNLMKFDEICDQDPGFYQICGHQRCARDVQMDHKGMLCGDFACKSDLRWKPIDNEAITCDGK